METVCFKTWRSLRQFFIKPLFSQTGLTVTDSRMIWCVVPQIVASNCWLELAFLIIYSYVSCQRKKKKIDNNNNNPCDQMETAL